MIKEVALVLGLSFVVLLFLGLINNYSIITWLMLLATLTMIDEDFGR